MVRNIIFDMGNVLLRFDPFVSLNGFCQTQEARDLIYKELFCGEEWVKGDLGLMNADERFLSVSERIPEKYHGELKKCTYGWDICMIPIDGAKEFCRFVKEKGYRIFILSNAGQEFYTYFTREYNLDFFDGFVVSSDIHIIKPDEGIYKYLLDKYSLKAEECFFIDDCEPNVAAAKKTGMNGIVFRDSFEEIKNILTKEKEI